MKLSIALCGGIILEEALDLSFDRLLMMMMMMQSAIETALVPEVGMKGRAGKRGSTAHAPVRVSRKLQKGLERMKV